MIRKSTFSLRYANVNKVNNLDRLMEESIRVVNLYIDSLWKKKKTKFVDFKVDTWLSARMQQCLGKQASEIVKSQHKKPLKSVRKPVFKRPVINLDSRFVDIRFVEEGKFDTWIKLSSLGDKLSVKLPSKKHKHYLSLIKEGYLLKHSARLRKTISGYEVDFYLEKKEPAKNTAGKVVGFDCGYKRMLVSSENKIFDEGLENIYEKISRKKQGSNSFKRALKERDNLINKTVKSIDLAGVLEVVVEDLKSVKSKTRGKIRKEFVNKLQRWSYPKVLGRLSHVCEDKGVFFTKVDPSYTSRTCSLCGAIHKNSRKGVKFKCVVCGYEIDADYNASINIQRRGVYSLSAMKSH
jgi:putative transposase